MAVLTTDWATYIKYYPWFEQSIKNQTSGLNPSRKDIKMTKTLVIPDIRIWAVVGSPAIGFHILLEVDGEFYIGDDMANEPFTLEICDSDGKRYHLTRAQVRSIKRYKCDKDSQKTELWKSVWEREDLANLLTEHFEKIIDGLENALWDELKEVQK